MIKEVEVYVAGDVASAYLIKANLENAGLQARVDNEHLSGAYCLDGMVPRVLVPADQEAQAREVLQEIRLKSEQSPDLEE